MKIDITYHGMTNIPFSVRERIRARFEEVKKLAMLQFPNSLKNLETLYVHVTDDIPRVVGRCHAHGRIDLHTQAVLQEPDYVINDTIPHEFAHLLCFLNPRYGRDHNRGWKHVCVTLGGSGSRTAPPIFKIARKRKTKMFEYKVPGAGAVWLSSTRRNKMLKGRTSYAYKNIPIKLEHATGRTKELS